MPINEDWLEPRGRRGGCVTTRSNPTAALSFISLSSIYALILLSCLISFLVLILSFVSVWVGWWVMWSPLHSTAKRDAVLVWRDLISSTAKRSQKCQARRRGEEFDLPTISNAYHICCTRVHIVDMWQSWGSMRVSQSHRVAIVSLESHEKANATWGREKGDGVGKRGRLSIWFVWARVVYDSRSAFECVWLGWVLSWVDSIRFYPLLSHLPSSPLPLPLHCLHENSTRRMVVVVTSDIIDTNDDTNNTNTSHHTKICSNNACMQWRLFL